MVALDRPGHILLPATDPALAPAALPAAGGPTPTDPPAVPASKQRSVWRNAFGIEGFNIAYFYLEMRYDTDGFKLGGGGSVDIGPASLELAVHGRVSPPSVSAFYFSLTGASLERGVTILDLVRIVTPNPAPALRPLDSVVVRGITLCAVADPDGWTNRATGQRWAPGFYARGDIAFGTNTWQFQVCIRPIGLYISTQVENPSNWVASSSSPAGTASRARSSCSTPETSRRAGFRTGSSISPAVSPFSATRSSPSRRSWERAGSPSISP
ncbi:hypothetical protein LMJ38_32990 [Streptomyces sp. R1]|uniref:hypothetical protein n=1 Tax=Streptomyces sp. R1 TaxID=1509279 RepID=UPI001E45ECF4|nr:hypothetical protein [Streptomyces sp. R1]MCC8340718.1 hypothetical protein [Streptomyces sp. R1]